MMNPEILRVRGYRDQSLCRRAGVDDGFVFELLTRLVLHRRLVGQLRGDEHSHSLDDIGRAAEDIRCGNTIIITTTIVIVILIIVEFVESLFVKLISLVIVVVVCAILFIHEVSICLLLLFTTTCVNTQ